MKQMKILHNVTSVGKASFGLGQISVNLAQAQSTLGHNVVMWCLSDVEEILWASNTHDFPSDRISRFKLSGPKSLCFSPEMYRYASMAAPSMFDIVHQHGIWTSISRSTLVFSKKKKIPVVIAPHGSLNEWAINKSRWKKQIALFAYERENLRLASCLHATSENEIVDFRNFGLNNPIAYIENGIPETSLFVVGCSERFRDQNAIETDKRILFFLSRISPKKGLMMLVHAINSLQDDFDGWQLIIAGTDEFDHKKDVESLVSQLNLEDKIKIIGPLYDQAKYDAFAAADLFILPSYSEGAPMVVLDSLAAGVPVITTKASTWSDLSDYNCGWWTDINTSAIIVALREAVAMSTEELQQMGRQGKNLIVSKYTWLHLSHKTIRLYDWLLGRVDKPDFVLID